jgi:hypothetical protein
MNSFNSLKNGSGVINQLAKLKITTVPSYVYSSYTIANVNVIPSISSDGLYTILTITNTAGTTINFTGIDTIDLLCVGGGGGGGFPAFGSGGGGGGGGGGVVYITNYSIRSGQNITIQVGAGGTPGGTPSHGGRGANTIFGSVVALGGGGGGGGGIAYNSTINDGGSGGGQGPDGGQAGNATQSSSTSGGYGNTGGSRNQTSISAGGGGGAGEVGGNAPSNMTGGKGGNGIAISITGSSLYYGGGGGGGAYYSSSVAGTPSAGGLGGGGTGGSGWDASSRIDIQANGTNGLGGGGGGCGGRNLSNIGSGGIGCIIIRYLTRKPANIIYNDIPRFYTSIEVLGTTGYNSFKLFAGKNTTPYAIFDNSGDDLVNVMYDDAGIGYGARIKNGGQLATFFIDGSSNFISFNSVRMTGVSLFNSKNTIDDVIILGNGSFAHLFIAKYDIKMILSWYVKIVAQNPYYNSYQYNDYIMTDNNKNVIAVGRYTANPFTFYSVDNSTNIQLTFTLKQSDSWVSPDGFVVKYSSTGVLQWVRRLGFVGTINGMNIDSSNNIYFCGSALSPFVVFGTDNTTAYKTFTVPSGYNVFAGGAFVVKYSPTGDILLATYIVTGTNIYGSNVNAWESKKINNNPLINSNNEMFLVLYGLPGGSGTNYIYDTNNTTTNFLNTQQTNIEIIKYGNDNSFKWINTMDGNSMTVLSAILDNNSNIHLSGTFLSTLNIYNNNKTLYNSYNSLGYADVFAVKYGNDSSLQWVSTIKSSGNDMFKSASLDKNGNYILFGGYNGVLNIYYNNTTQYTPTFDTSSNDLFLIKYNTDGTINFATHMGGKSDETSTALMKLDNSNNIYITAGYTDRVYFYNGNSNLITNTYLNADLSGSVFLVKYDSNGLYQWGARSIGGTSTTQSPSAYRLVTDRNNNVITYGIFSSPTFTFYDSGNTNFMDISNNTNSSYPTDFYIAKYDSNGVGKWARRLGDNNYYKNNLGSNNNP